MDLLESSSDHVPMEVVEFDVLTAGLLRRYLFFTHYLLYPFRLMFVFYSFIISKRQQVSTFCTLLSWFCC